MKVPARTSNEAPPDYSGDDGSTPDQDNGAEMMAEFFRQSAAESVGVDLSSEETSSETTDPETGDELEAPEADEASPAEGEESGDEGESGSGEEETEEETGDADEEDEQGGEEESGDDSRESPESEEDDDDDQLLPEHRQQQESSSEAQADPQKFFDDLKKAYQLTPELQARIEEEGFEAVLPEILARTHMAAVQQTMQAMPQMIDSRVEQRTAEKTAEERFFSAWPQVKEFLKENPDKREEVERLSEWYKQRPGITEKKYIKEFGREVVETFGLPLDVEEETGEEATGDETPHKTGERKTVNTKKGKKGKKGTQKPFKPAGKGANSGNNGSAIPDNWFARVAAEEGRGG